VEPAGQDVTLRQGGLLIRKRRAVAVARRRTPRPTDVPSQRPWTRPGPRRDG